MRSIWFLRASLLGGLLLLVACSWLRAAEPERAPKSVADILIALGEAPPPHRLSAEQMALAPKGKELFWNGITTDAKGDSTPVQSHFFRCTSCHLTTREDPSLLVSAAGPRLAWVVEHDQHLLPGTTLYGAVNKTAWYENYEKKYGADLVSEPQKNIRAAIQLCSEACSQGRTLQPWEIDAVLAYLWTLQYRTADLDLTADEANRIQAALGAGQPDPQLIQLIHAKYLARTPTTFAAAKEFDPGSGGSTGDLATGRMVFERACLSCHGPAGPSTFDMTTKDGVASLAEDAQDGEAIENIREGHAPPKDHQGRYMPEYSLERLSDAQIRALFTFVGVEAKVRMDDGGASAATPRADSATAAPVGGDPAAAALHVFTTRCADCHGRKAGLDYQKFNYVEDLAKLAAEPKYITPGAPDKSKLYLLAAHLQKPFMPKKRAQLAPAELEAIKAWIAGLK